MFRSAILLVAVSILACSQPAPPDTRAAGDHELPAEPVEPGALPLGCTAVPASEIEVIGDARLAVDRRIVTRAAELWGERATDAQVDGAMAGVLAQTGLSREALADELEGRGMSLAGYRDDTRREIERLLVAGRAVGSAEDEAAMRRWLDDVRARWERVETRRIDGQCVEAWPEVDRDRIALRGFAALPERAIREGLSAERYRAELEPRLRRAERDLEGAYANHGFVEAKATSLPEAGRWVIELSEGRRFRAGRVRLLEGADRREQPMPHGALTWSEEGWFSRRAMQRSIEVVKQRLGATIEPEVHVHDGIVDVDLIVVDRAR